MKGIIAMDKYNDFKREIAYTEKKMKTIIMFNIKKDAGKKVCLKA